MGGLTMRLLERKLDGELVFSEFISKSGVRLASQFLKKSSPLKGSAPMLCW